MLGALVKPLAVFLVGASTAAVVPGPAPLALFAAVITSAVAKMTLFEGLRAVKGGAETPGAGASDAHADKPLHPYRKVEHTVVEGTIPAPVDDVWALVRDFGGWASWWPAFTSCSVDGADGVGQVRTLGYDGLRFYDEQLTVRDDGRHVVEYLLLKAQPEVPATHVRTTVELVAAGPTATQVTWSAVFQPAAGAAVSTLRAGQAAAYEAGIAALRARLSPASPARSVRVSVTKVAMVADGSVAHLTLSVGGVRAHSLRLTPAGTPVSAEPVSLHLTDAAEAVELGLEDADGSVVAAGSLAAAALLGPTDGPAPTTHEVALGCGAEGSGAPVATYALSVVDAPPASAAEAATKLLFALIPELQQQLMQTAFLLGHDDGRWAYAAYPSASAAHPLPKFSAVLPPSEVIQPPRVGHLVQRNAEFLYAQARLLKLLVDTSAAGPVPPAMRARLAALQAEVRAVLAEDPFAVPFHGAVAKPTRIVDRWMTDEEVAGQMIRGVNPMKITRVTADDATAVLPAVFHGLVAADGRDIATLRADKALFYADYPELMIGELDAASGAYTHQAVSPVLDSDVGARKYWYAPRLVLYKKASGKLSILGFTLTRKDDGHDEVYTAATHPPTTYQLAKLHLTAADNQTHQFVSHLGLTHLLAEPFIVAAHNALPADHVLTALLRPHFVDTIGINFLARQTLVSSVVPLTDSTFSVGTSNAMAVFSSAYAGWDFIGDNFPNGLAKRGFGPDASVDGLDGFYYRDDGFKVWNALMRHVSRVLTAHYSAVGGGDADAAVAADPALAAWCAEMRAPDEAAIASFPSAFGSVEALTEALVSIIFLCSAQHAAVNFPQAEYVSYVPNRPDSLRTPMPPTPTGGDLPQAALGDALPAMGASLFQTLFAYLLTTPTDTPASAYAALAESHPAAVGAFAADLGRLTEEIDARNAALVAADEQPYPYLSPANMPLSIDI